MSNALSIEAAAVLSNPRACTSIAVLDYTYRVTGSDSVEVDSRQCDYTTTYKMTRDEARDHYRNHVGYGWRRVA